MMSPSFLDIVKLNAYYAQGHILHDISLTVSKEEAVFILGLNGMGKTTLLRSVMGLAPPRFTGTIGFGGLELTKMRPNKIAALGLGYVPQGRRLFPSLSVEEHLNLFYRKNDDRNAREWTRDIVYSLFPVLKERRKIRGTLLSGGEQQMLAIGRALVTNPRLLIMDEPTEGLSPYVIRLILETCEELRGTGASMLFTEQNLEVAATLADRVLILETGRFVHETRKKDCASNKEFMDELSKLLWSEPH